MSDLTKKLRIIANWDAKGDGKRKTDCVTWQAADLIEQQQQRIEELEYRAEEAEGRLSVVLDKHGQPDSYKCTIYDLTPLEVEKKLQDGIKRLGWLPPDEATALRQERDELSATVERLRDYIERGSPYSTNPSKCERKAILAATSQQKPNAVKREAS